MYRTLPYLQRNIGIKAFRGRLSMHLSVSPDQAFPGNASGGTEM